MSGADSVPGAQRFDIRRRLGAGGVGAVYEAFDGERQAVVALKSLRSMNALAIYRFKREFRSLADIVHPNLVKLYELLSTDESWFFTMECIDGVPWRRWVRPGTFVRPESSGDGPDTEPLEQAASRGSRVERGRVGALDERRLRAALPQLVNGLSALHRMGKLHRDVKPSNVLVESATSRVVLCDFGLVAERQVTRDDQTYERHIVGTPGYMAPEQAAGEPVNEAADWYSVGALLYEALAGRLPFLGDGWEVIQEKQRVPAPPVHTFNPQAPPDLAGIAMELLEIDPTRRLRGRELRERLGIADEGLTLGTGAASVDVPFVGREIQLRVLGQALDRVRDGEVVVARVHGESGMGKSMLLRQFLETVNDAVVLEGRCYERESVPFKAFDTVVDALTQHLLGLDEREVSQVLPEEIGALARLFPVLRRVEQVAVPRGGAPTPTDPQETRRRAFAALRRLLDRLSRERPIVLSIDDLHWGDVDSAALLSELIRQPGAPRMLVLAAYRGDEAPNAAFLRGFLPHAEGALDVPVHPFSRGEMATLLTALTDGASDAHRQDLDALMDEANGNPFIMTELVHYARGRYGDLDGVPRGISYDDVLERRFAMLEPEAAAMLEAVAMAGRPISQEAAKRAALPDDDGEAVLRILSSAHLVRTSGARAADSVEMYHDRIRLAVVGRLTASERTHWCRRLASALEVSNHPDVESLAELFYGAGEPSKAAFYAVVAAEQASESLAFERAAGLLQFALDVQDEQRAAGGTAPVDGVTRSALLGRLGDALVNAGKGVAGADAFLEAARGAAREDAVGYRIRASEQLLRSGAIDRGMEILLELLHSIGLRVPSTSVGSLVSLLWRRARISMRGFKFVERDADEVPRDVALRIDTLWAAAAGLGMTDTLKGMDLQTRHLVWALDSGDKRRIARAVTTEAMYSCTGGEATRKRSRTLVARAVRLAEETAEPQAVGYSYGTEALYHYYLGDFRAALEWTDRAIRVLRDQCRGVAWELDSSSLFRIWSHYYLGNIATLGEEVPALVREARERDNLFAHTSLNVGQAAMHYLARDRVEEGRRVGAEVMARWSFAGFHLQHYWAFLSNTAFDIYDRRGLSAFQHARGMWNVIRRAYLMRVSVVRVETTELLGRSALLAAQMSPAVRRRATSTATWAAKKLGREPSAWAQAHSVLLRAGLAHIDDRAVRAAALYAQAETQFAECGMKAHGMAARWRRAQLSDLSQSRLLVREVDEWCAAQRIVYPEAYLGMLAPASPIASSVLSTQERNLLSGD